MKSTCYKPSRTFYLNRKTRKCKTHMHTNRHIRDIVLYPFNKGLGKTTRAKSVENTPKILRHLFNTNYRIHSLKKSSLRTVETAATAIYKLRRKIGKKPCISIGGDHTVSIGSILASMSMYPHMKIIYFDAHGDINTSKSSITGNKHGMVLSYILDKGFDPNNILYVGIRCLDPYEVDKIDKLGISYLTPNTHDIEEKIERFIGNCPTHISFDVDVLDSSIMPWTGLPTKGGLYWGQIARIMEVIEPAMVAIDIAELAF